MTGQKHLVKCRCILQHFKNRPNAPLHQFIVFSVIDDDGKVLPKYAQCNNCNVIHRVTDICKSDIILGKDAMATIATIEDVQASLPEKLQSILTQNNADLATCENVQFIYENKHWGEFAVLVAESDKDTGYRTGKFVRILGDSLFKVESFEREEIIK